MIQDILSVPIPSDAARLVGHILSIIISIVLDNPKPVWTVELVPFNPGDPTYESLFIYGLFFDGLFFPLEVIFVPVELAVDVPLLVIEEVADYFLASFNFYSYTKSTAY